MTVSNDLEFPHPSLAQATRIWWKIGVLSFGGPAAQIALIHKEIVEENNWLSEQQFLNALSFCMLLPGPEATQIAAYAGWRLHGVLGGLIAGLLFVLPGAAIIMALAWIYSVYGNVPLVAALFYGIKAAVLVIVVQALFRVAKKALSQNIHWIIAGLAFVGIFFLSIPFPFIILAAGFTGWILGVKQASDVAPSIPNISVKQTTKTVLLWLGIWLSPLFALALLGAPDLLIDIGRFFTTLAVVTFGGAYAVLAYMAQDVVVQFGWLTAGEMIDALGLAETTPGPLILVTQFVGFLAGYKDAGLMMALAASLLTLWVTFVPCFLWIFAGAPYIEWITEQPRLRGALQAITAAVVGVILNLSIWFALHVLFGKVEKKQLGFLTLWIPDVSSIQWLAIGLFMLSTYLTFRWRFDMFKILAITALLGAGGKFILS
ncbi:chromate efflux transporter [Ahrensia marina]|uniref:Chromate transporter n=1 Tax=Ahrensia marina TaxID=1514904 RepID=A0A0M9GP88_9HYPH|nr:chromate efflux transporter [Ahrensia marina]KPB02597.1 chromate transporter [Ahrensia marina]